MLSDNAREIVERYWAERFGRSPKQMHTAGVLVVPHAADLRGYAGLYAYLREETCMVSVPETYVSDAKNALAGHGAEEVFEPAELSGLLGGDAGRVVGPAALAYADTSTFRPAAGAGRLLDTNDERLLRDLEAACDATEWDHADIDYDRRPIFGCFDADALVAAASYRVRGERIASVGIITHPAHRGRGYARGAASAATAYALDQGLVVEWQTLEANAPSMAVARAIGFESYCRTIAVRMRSE